MLKPVVQYYVV